MYSKIDVKKDLYKSKEMARFIHYDGQTGKLIYEVLIFGKPHQFPLYVMGNESSIKEVKIGQSVISITTTTPALADDLKGAKFESEMKGSSLNRWIDNAINNEELICLAQ